MHLKHMWLAMTPPRRTLFQKIVSPHNWRGFLGLLATACDPMAVIWRYYLKKGAYPYVVRLRTPIGSIKLELYSRADLITVHEVFFRQDYLASSKIRHVVDCGANIGVSCAYFLTRAREVRVRAYEAAPVNIARAKKNLASFGDRFELVECAIGTEKGLVRFGIEPSGRYGGIDVPDCPDYIEVPCLRAEDELAQLLRDHSRIDVLKLDVEGMETPIIRSLSTPTLAAISCIMAECDGAEVQLPTFRYHQMLCIARFTLADSRAF